MRFRSTTSLAGLLVAVAAAAVLVPGLGAAPLWDDDEGRNTGCSLAMRTGGDLVVPTFNGRLRIEKPPLVNWLQLCGFAVAGTNETGARIGSAAVTIGTCLLTWRIGSRLFGGAAGTWAGVVMATCLWTAVGGRAATPDAVLVFCTTLALWLFVRGLHDGTTPDGCAGGPRITRGSAAAVGVACGLAMLAKGPVGLVPPLAAFVGFATWQALPAAGTGTPPRRLGAALGASLRGCHAGTIVAAALAVAAPWVVLVTLRTAGEWPRGFLFVHNVGRFAAPMEGHSGSLLYYPAVALLGTFPWSMASALVGLHLLASARGGAGAAPAPGARLAIAWLAAWFIPFSLAGTKLPGYIWPAYPAIALAVGSFLDAWITRPAPAVDRWMRLAWGLLAVSGLALVCAAPVFAHRLAPGGAWLGLVGLVPLAGGIGGWVLQARDRRFAAAASWAATACATVGVLAACGPACVAASGGLPRLLAGIRPTAAGRQPVIATFGTPPSTVFYGGLAAADGRVVDLEHPAAFAAIVARSPEAHLVVDARYEPQAREALPAGHLLLGDTVCPPGRRRVLLFGPAPGDDDLRLAGGPDARVVPR